MSLQSSDAVSDRRWKSIVERLRDENDTLREENEQLKAQFAIDHIWPREWGLIPSEGRVLSLLVTRPLVSRDGALASLYGERPDAEPDEHIVDVWIHRIRKKLRPFGIEIETIRTRGWRIVESQRKRLNAIGRPQ